MPFNPFCGCKQFHLSAEPSFHINHSLHFSSSYQMLCSGLPSAWPPHLGGEVCEVALCIQVEPSLCLWGREVPLACLETQWALFWWTHISSVMAETTTHHHPAADFLLQVTPFSGYPTPSLVWFEMLYFLEGPILHAFVYAFSFCLDDTPPPLAHIHTRTQTNTCTLSVY